MLGATTDLAAIASAAIGNGVHWTLPEPADLNVNLVRLDPGESIAAHVNLELDVLFVVLEGNGWLEIDDREHGLSQHTLANVRAGSTRTVRAADDGLTYVTVHRRRGGLSLGRPR